MALERVLRFAGVEQPGFDKAVPAAGDQVIAALRHIQTDDQIAMVLDFVSRFYGVTLADRQIAGGRGGAQAGTAGRLGQSCGAGRLGRMAGQTGLAGRCVGDRAWRRLIGGHNRYERRAGGER